ncbi:MAG TPA: hypothetical protein DCR55_14410 [Lentisphaeria bacterium]|nr:hypothetical protein [Lentisphaeria bacterium]
MPDFHHWHHAKGREYCDAGYAVHLPVIEMMLGTYRSPKGDWPTAYGVVSGEPPSSFVVDPVPISAIMTREAKAEILASLALLLRYGQPLPEALADIAAHSPGQRKAAVLQHDARAC